MKGYSLTHLADGALLRDLAALVSTDHATTASLLAHLAEVEARELHLAAAYPSMYAYCVGELRLSEDMACKRIRAARVAREFPVLYPAVADGRLSLGAVLLLAPRLTAENVDGLVAAASRKSRSEIEVLLAERFPQAEVATRVEPVGPAPTLEGVDKGPVRRPELSAPGRMNDGATPRVAPLAPERYALQLTMRQELHDKLRHAQRLLGHVVRPGDVAEVLERALDALIEKLEKRKCGAAARRGPRRASKSARHIPTHVREAVWKRDGGRCTFVSESGRRCESREQIEYDHVVPVARGGEPTVEGTRLLCRQHNQFEAERTFGAGFMEEKRAQARRAAQAKLAEKVRRAHWTRPQSEPPCEAEAHEPANPPAALDQDAAREVVPWLRSLGIRADQAKRAAEAIAHLTDAPLEERVKAAFAFHAQVRFPNSRRPANGLATVT